MCTGVQMCLRMHTGVHMSLPVCTSVQTRSLSSLPRTLLRLISYSVAGCSLVTVNSVTVFGTTELSSRPTEEEQKPQ